MPARVHTDEQYDLFSGSIEYSQCSLRGAKLPHRERVSAAQTDCEQFVPPMQQTGARQ